MFFPQLVATPSESPLVKQSTLPLLLLIRYPGTPSFLLTLLPVVKLLHAGPPASAIAAFNVATSRIAAILSGTQVLFISAQVRSQLCFLPFLENTNAPDGGGEGAGGAGTGAGDASHSLPHDRLWLRPSTAMFGSFASR